MYLAYQNRKFRYLTNVRPQTDLRVTAISPFSKAIRELNNPIPNFADAVVALREELSHQGLVSRGFGHQKFLLDSTLTTLGRASWTDFRQLYETYLRLTRSLRRN